MSVQKMSRAVMPGMTNHRGILFGGTLMQWMDELSGIAARRFDGGEVATVSVKEIRFLRPVSLGTFLDITAQVAAVGNTSLTVSVTAWMDRDGSGEKQEKAAEGEFVYVAVDEQGKPRKAGKQNENRSSSN